MPSITYSCPGCGKSIAGKEVPPDGLYHCKCGEVIYLPVDEASSETSPKAQPAIPKPVFLVMATLILILFVSTIHLYVSLADTKAEVEGSLSDIKSSLTKDIQNETDETLMELNTLKEQIESENSRIKAELGKTAMQLVDQIVSESQELIQRIDSVQADLDRLFGRSKDEERNNEVRYADLSVQVAAISKQLVDQGDVIIALTKAIGDFSKQDFIEMVRVLDAIADKCTELETISDALRTGYGKNVREFELVWNKIDETIQAINTHTGEISSLERRLSSLVRYAETNASNISTLAKAIKSLGDDIDNLDRRLRVLEYNR